MKKLLAILVLGLLWCNTGFANSETIVLKCKDDGKYYEYTLVKEKYDVFEIDDKKIIFERKQDNGLHVKRQFNRETKILKTEAFNPDNTLLLESSIKCREELVKKEQTTKEKSIAWKIDNKYLTPECFVYQWYSGDQYERFFETYFKKKADYDSPEFNDFRNNIGNYINKEVPLEHSIDVEWGSVTQLSVTTYLDSCLSKEPKTKIKGEYVGTYFYYNVIEALQVSLSSTLAPHLDKDFEEIKLVKYSYRLGSMGEKHTFIIYGIVQLKNGKKVILPLRNFDNEEQAKKTILTLK